jgi:hypothetical protein
MSAVLGTLERYSHGEHTKLSNALSALIHRFAENFGCQHREMSRPFSRQGETYRVCIGCGARRQFDAKTWNSSGRHYYKPARVAELQDVDMTALRSI